MPDESAATSAEGPADPGTPVDPADVDARPTERDVFPADADALPADPDAPPADPTAVSAASTDPGAVPSEEWLAAHAVPGRVRRAPRLGSFVVAGVLAGMVVGTVLTLLAVPRSGLSADGSGGVLPFLGGYNGVLLETSLALGLVGGLVGAALALRADRRSRR